MKKNYSVVLLEEDQDKNPELFLHKLNELNNRKNEMIKSMRNSTEINAINNICDLIEEESKSA